MSLYNKELLDKCKKEVAKDANGWHEWDHVPLIDQNRLWPIVCERYATEKANWYSGKWKAEADGQLICDGVMVFPSWEEIAAMLNEREYLKSKWLCEKHPEKEMGHDGCGFPGILQDDQVSMLLTQKRLAEQELRETKQYLGEQIKNLKEELDDKFTRS